MNQQRKLTPVEIRDIIELLTKLGEREVETFILNCEGGQELLDENPGLILSLYSPALSYRNNADQIIRLLIRDTNNLKHLISLDGFSSALERSNSPLFQTVSRLTAVQFAIETPQLHDSHETVKAAMESADLSINAGKPQDAVDRLHTAIHGHLKHICRKMELEFKKDDTAQHLLSLIRTHHLQEKEFEQSSPAGKLLGNLGKFISMLGEFRNNKSLSHANEELLNTHDAQLVVNFAKSALTYLDSNFNKTEMPQD